MPRIARELSDAAVRRMKWTTTKSGPNAGKPRAALHPVGGVSGLHLYCRAPAPGADTAGRSWVLRVQVGAKRRDIGLGPYPEVTLSEARQRARETKAKIRQGIDPAAERRALKSALIAAQAQDVTFAEVAQRFYEKKARELKTATQATRLRTRLDSYAIPALGHLLVRDIDRAHIIECLRPIWETKTETAQRVRIYVERILDIAHAEGLRSGENPARWKGNLELSLPKPGTITRVQHLKALPYAEMPAFWASLKALDTPSSKTLQFIILTASRSGEARKATWEEVDLQARVWTVPATRMKGGRAHKVPLCPAALALLTSLPNREGHLFISVRGNPLSDAYLSKVPKLLGHDVTAHGFRSTFRTWAQECTRVADEVAELALAHVGTDATRAAYARGELLEKRRKLMSDWQRYCEGHR